MVNHFRVLDILYTTATIEGPIRNFMYRSGEVDGFGIVTGVESLFSDSGDLLRDVDFLEKTAVAETSVFDSLKGFRENEFRETES